MKLHELIESSETEITLEFLGYLWPHLLAYINNVHWQDDGVTGKKVLEQLFLSPRGQKLMYNGKMERIIFGYQDDKTLTMKQALSDPRSQGMHSFFKSGKTWDPLSAYAEEHYSGAPGEPDYPTSYIVIEQSGKALDISMIYPYYKDLDSDQLKAININEADISNYLERASHYGEVLAPYYPTASKGEDPVW